MKKTFLSLMAIVCVLTISAQRPQAGELSSGMSIYDFKVKDDAGKDVSLADYKLNYIIAIGYPDEQPEAKPRDASKVKYIK